MRNPDIKKQILVEMIAETKENLKKMCKKDNLNTNGAISKVSDFPLPVGLHRNTSCPFKYPITAFFGCLLCVHISIVLNQILWPPPY